MCSVGSFDVDSFYCGDSAVLMSQLPDQSIDMVMTSPPYDGLRDYKDKPSFDLHVIGEQSFRVLKDGGVAVVVIQDQTKDYAKSLSSFRMCLDWCDSFGFKLFENLIYQKNGAEGGWWTHRFRVDHEYMFVFLKGKKPQYFNKESVRQKSKHAGKIRGHSTSRYTDGSLVKSDTSIINDTKCPGTIWSYTDTAKGTSAKHEHPATYPDKLPYDFIQCFCPLDRIVLDPFMGSGSTALAAKASKRHFIGFDIAQEYVDLAKRRLVDDFAAYNENVRIWMSKQLPQFAFASKIIQH